MSGQGLIEPTNEELDPTVVNRGICPLVSKEPLGMSECQYYGSPSKLSNPCKRNSGCFSSFDQKRIEPPIQTPNSR